MVPSPTSWLPCTLDWSPLDCWAASASEILNRRTWPIGPRSQAVSSGNPLRVTDANDFDELLQPPVSMAANEHRPTNAIADEMELGGIHRDFGPNHRLGPNILHCEVQRSSFEKISTPETFGRGGHGGSLVSSQ